MVAADPDLAGHPALRERGRRCSSRRPRRLPGQGVRVRAGDADRSPDDDRAGPAAGRPAGQRHPADVRPGPRGAVLADRVAAPVASPGPGCSTSSPAPARSGSRRSAAAPAMRCFVESDRRRRPTCCATTSTTIGLAGAECVAEPVDRLSARRRAGVAVRRGVPRPALRPRRRRLAASSPLCSTAAGWPTAPSSSSSGPPAAASGSGRAGFDGTAPAAMARRRFGTVAPRRDTGANPTSER